MANDRIFIVCDGCKDYKGLAKWNPGGSIYLFESVIDILNDFFEQHQDCTRHELDLGDSVGFSFGSEAVVCQEGYHEDTQEHREELLRLSAIDREKRDREEKRLRNKDANDLKKILKRKEIEENQHVKTG